MTPPAPPYIHPDQRVGEGGEGGWWWWWLLLSSLLFMEVAALLLPGLLLWSHRMEMAPGLGNTKTKTLNLLKEFMGQTIASLAAAATTLGRFLHFYIELCSVDWTWTE